MGQDPMQLFAAVSLVILVTLAVIYRLRQSQPPPHVQRHFRPCPPRTDAQYVPGAHGWKCWHIEHLEDWRKTLLSLIVLAVLMIGTSFAAVVRQGPVVAAVLLVIGLSALINAGRVIAYARRRTRRTHRTA